MNKLQCAKDMAKSHFQIEPNLRYIAILEPLREDDPNDPIRLVEVVEGTMERGFEPIGFPSNPGRGFYFPFQIIEVSPREYESAHQGGHIRFENRDWKIVQEIPRA